MLSVALHILHCGQGDTILLSLNEKIWVLLDCNLPAGSSRQLFFETVGRLGITRLDLICLTHPHEDHFLGMRAIIEYFQKDGRSIGAFCDSGISPRAIYALMNLQGDIKSNSGEYVRLWELLSDIFENGVDYILAHERSSDLIVTGTGESVRLIPIGPAPIAIRNKIDEALKKGKLTGKIREELNLASVVLALRVRGRLDFDGLLTGDTDGSGMNRAIAFYGAVDGRAEETVQFDVVKVAHHGSLDSHRGSVIARRGKSDRSVAAISCGGSSSVLPDREVMRDFIDSGWVLLLTTKRTAPPAPSYALELSDRSESTDIRDLTISWSDSMGLKWEPSASQVSTDELVHYGSANRTS